MPSGSRSRDDVIAILTETFRRDGVDGATLSVLSQETGLGRSSLYHYFPGGKLEMEEQVLESVESRLRDHLLSRLAVAELAPEVRVREMLDALVLFYDGGRKRCLVERLCSSVDRRRFDPRLGALLRDWIAALSATLVDGGVEPTIARDRAEEAVALVQGSLVLCDALRDTGPFERVLRRLASDLLQVP